MTDIESGQSPMAKVVLCHHGLPVVHRISRRSHSYGRSFSCCPIHWEDSKHCPFFSWDPPDLRSDEPGAQTPVKQYQTTAEYMLAPPTASASSHQVKVRLFFPFLRDDALIQNQRLMSISFYNFPLCGKGEKRPAASSTEDVLQDPSSSRKRTCTGLDSPSRQCGRPSPPPSKNPATAQSEFRPARPVIYEETIQDTLDTLPAIPIYVRELKRQISTLQESNDLLESRIRQLEKQYVLRNCASNGYLNAFFHARFHFRLWETRDGEGLIDDLSHDSVTLSSRQLVRDLFSV
ncbi:hypothetical protein BGY98DRAFT_272161 [Russula aff. rugulosa BPL654]|nr:hypothetical protein BGY98DRAFT_272161 [Russula aff. rugulosa BPL654]